MEENGKIDPMSPLATQAGRNFLRTVARVLVGAES